MGKINFSFLKDRKNLIIITLSVIAFAFVLFVVGQAIAKNKLRKELLETRNELSNAIGTIEVSEGLYVRTAIENGRLDREYRDILGENQRLSEEINKREEDIRLLTQVNATLRENVKFEGNGRTTVISPGVCNNNSTSTPGNNQNGSSGGTTTVPNPNDVFVIVPNIRVDFDLKEDGFRVFGFTETNPSLAENPVGLASLELEQVDPFIIDLAVTQSSDGWRAIAYEQQGRLALDIGELQVNPARQRLSWQERIGIGSRVSIDSDSFGLHPEIEIKLGQRGSWEVGVGPFFVIEDNLVYKGTSVGVTLYPFTRRMGR